MKARWIPGSTSSDPEGKGFSSLAEVRRHVLGTPQASDVVVLEESDERDDMRDDTGMVSERNSCNS